MIRIKIQYITGLEQARDNYYVIALVKLIQGVKSHFEKYMYIYNSMSYVQQKSRCFFQRQGWTLTEYLEKYMAPHTTVEKFGGATINKPGVIVHEMVLISI